MDDLQRLNKSLQSIKQKLEIIRQKNDSLKILNYKLKAFILLFSKNQTENLKKNFIKNSPFNKLKEENFLDFINNIEKKEEKDFLKLKNSGKKEKDLNDFLETINNSGKNKNFIINAHKIVNYLHENKKSSLDSMIKNTGISRYRCIEIINELVNNEPRIILKDNNKGIEYCLNL